MATINFVVSGNRIATESFAIGKIYDIIFKNGNSLICACNHVGNNFVVFQRELPELLFTLNMETASSVRSIEETGGGGGTYNYNSLENKPQINSVELSGNKSSSDLGLQSALDTSQLDAVNSGITAAKVTVFEGKQDAITSSNKLSADLVSDATTTNKFVTTAEKTTWNAKQNALTASQLDAVNSGITAAKVTVFEGKQDAITSSSKLSADLVDDTTTANKFVTAADKTAWNAKQNAIDSLHMLDADLVDDTTATHKFATAAQLSQITTNKNNISTDEAALVELVDGGAKNIIEVGNAICTKYGVTAVLSSDGSIVLSGKAEGATGNFLIVNDIKTGSQTASYASLIPIKSGIYKSEIYTASGLSDDRVILQVLNYNSSSDVDTFESDVFTTTKQYIDFRLMLKRTADFTTPLTVYPMCCTKAAWDISHAYQPYRPSYQELYEQVETKATVYDIFGTTNRINSGDNLDDYLTPGAYVSPTDSISQSLTNCPVTAAFRLEVLQVAAVDRYRQFIYPNGEGMFYIRNRLSGRWSAWYKFEGTAVT